MSYAIGDDVLIKQLTTNDDDSPMDQDLKGKWVARILEIRTSRNHRYPYILINWYNRPEDLVEFSRDLGREAHHGACELIATNDVDIILPGRPDSNY